MYNRAAEFFRDFLPQTPSLSLTQNVTASQFLGPLEHRFTTTRELRSSCVVVKWCSRDPKIGMLSRFGSNSMVEFDSQIPQNFRLPYYALYADIMQCIIGLPKYFWSKGSRGQRGLWPKRWVHRNFEHHLCLSYHVTKALKLAILRLIRLEWPISEL